MNKIKNIILLLVLLVTLIGCSGTQNKDLLLKLSFDEGSGYIVKDSSKNLSDANLQYIYKNPEFMPNSLEPKWLDYGIKGGSLLFDGYSNFIRYDYDDIALSGSNLSISVWVAPRYFESNQKEDTAIISQFNSSANEGLFLGFRDHGRLVFQVGIGDRNIRLDDKNNLLDRYEWNHVVAIFNGDKGMMSLYLNNSLVDQTRFFDGATIEPAYGEPLYIGKNSEEGSNATSSLNMFTGLMDELEIYKRVLEEKEINKKYVAPTNKEIIFDDIWLQNILQDDYYKPQYHGGPYQHWMNEPHAPIYYNGVYHLFFQFNMFGPYFANISWGHLVSDDLVNWRPLKEIIVPTKNTVAEDGVWSGGSTYDSNGVPVLLFTAGHYNNGLLSSQNVGLARPKDLNDPYLTEWVVDDELAIIQKPGEGVPGEFRDAHIIHEDGIWYLVIASASRTTNGGTALLYKTDDDNFKNWEYVGQLYEIPNQKGDLGRVWELPVLLPVWNKDKTIKKYILMISPAPADRADNDVFYFVGEFDKTKGRFIPDPEFIDNPKLLDYGNNVFTGPSGFVDPISGKSYVFSIMQDQRKPGDVYKSGWSHNVGLTREIYLLDDGMDVGIRPVDTLPNYQTVIYEKEDISIDDLNIDLLDIKGDMLHIKLTYKDINANQVGIKVRKNNKALEETIIYYDLLTNEVGVRTGLSGALNNYQNITGNFKGELITNRDEITMDIYLDRSILEVFFNEEKAISSRIYPDISSLGLEVFSLDGDAIIKEIIIGRMASIYDE